jgi:hypothetical protein
MRNSRASILIWEPKTDQVTYDGKDKSGKPIKLTYLRSKLDAQSGEIEPSFVNDQSGCSWHFMFRGIPERRWKTLACRNCRWDKVPPRKS